MRTLKVLESTTNQAGESVPVESIVMRDDGVVCRESLVCFSSSSLGLGTCQCHSHDPWKITPLPWNEVVELATGYEICGGPNSGFTVEPLELNLTPELEFNQVLAVAGLTVEDLERFCELSYRLDSNPLPKLRRLFPGFRICFMCQDQNRGSYWNWQDGDESLIVVELCDERDRGHGLTVWIETYGF